MCELFQNVLRESTNCPCGLSHVFFTGILLLCLLFLLCSCTISRIITTLQETLPSVSSNGDDEWVAWHLQGSRALPLAERSPSLWQVDCEPCTWFICLPSSRPSVSLTGEAQAGGESPALWRGLGHCGRGGTWRTERRSEEGGPSEALYFGWVGSLWRDLGGGAEGHGQKALKDAGERWSLGEGGNSWGAKNRSDCQCVFEGRAKGEGCERSEHPRERSCHFLRW